MGRELVVQVFIILVERGKIINNIRNTKEAV